MKASKVALAIAPAMLMAGLCLAITGIEGWLSKFGPTPNARLVLGRAAYRKTGRPAPGNRLRH